MLLYSLFGPLVSSPLLCLIQIHGVSSSPILPCFIHILTLEKTLMLGGLGAGGEGDARGWDGWMASLTRWRESEWTLGVGDGQGGLACCDSWGRKELDTTERLNWTEQNIFPVRNDWLIISKLILIWDLACEGIQYRGWSGWKYTPICSQPS